MGTAVVVLAGGASRRWSGRDKTAVDLAGTPVLEHAVRGLAAGAGLALGDVVVVGPPDHPVRPRLAAARWVREEPPGGGPVAGLAAAVAVLDAHLVDLVIVGAGDAPFAGAAVPALLAALDGGIARGIDGAIGVDAGGRDQPLLGAYRPAALRAAMPAEPAGARLRDLVAGLHLARVPVAARAALDLDTPADLATAERLLSS